MSQHTTVFDVVKRENELRKELERLGRPWFIRIETDDRGTIHATKVLEVEYGALYYVSRRSDKLPVQHVVRLVKDREAEAAWERIKETPEGEEFVKSWAKQGSTGVPVWD